jgi:hypothetical protein
VVEILELGARINSEKPFQHNWRMIVESGE